MKQFLSVLKFEFNNYFKNKSFVTITAFLMVLAAGAVAIAAMVMKGDEAGSEDKAVPGNSVVSEEELEDAKIVIVDESGLAADIINSPYLVGADVKMAESEDTVSKMLEEGTATVGFIIHELENYTCIMQNNSFFSSEQAAFEQALAAVYRNHYYEEHDLNAEELEALLTFTPESEVIIQGKDSVGNYWYTYVLVFGLYLLVFFYGQMIATSVTTEKSNRAIEILVTSVNSNSLIFGKVLAGAISGVIQAVLVLGSAMVSYSIFKEQLGGKLDFLFQIPVTVWVVFAVFGLLGYLLWAFMFGILGALASRTEDVNKTSTPLQMLYVVSFIVAMSGMYSSDSAWMKAASFIPFTSTNAMLVRSAMGTVEIWEMVVSAVLLLGSCVAVGVLAAAVFRMGTLMYGNPIKFSKALKMLKHQK